MVELDVVVIDTNNAEWHEATQWAGAFIAGFRSAQTRRGYRLDLDCWFAFCAVHELHPFRGLRRTHLELSAAARGAGPCAGARDVVSQDLHDQFVVSVAGIPTWPALRPCRMPIVDQSQRHCGSVVREGKATSPGDLQLSSFPETVISHCDSRRRLPGEQHPGGGCAVARAWRSPRSTSRRQRRTNKQRKHDQSNNAGDGNGDIGNYPELSSPGTTRDRRFHLTAVGGPAGLDCKIGCRCCECGTDDEDYVRARQRQHCAKEDE